MLNLLRTDLRRVFRDKGIYITLLCFFGVLLIAMITMKLVTSPDLVHKAVSSGMEIDADDMDDAAQFLSSTQTDFLSNLLFNGGLMSTLMAIFGAIIVCDDFSTGFAKNIFSCHTSPARYVVSKLITLAAVSAFFLAALSLFTCLLFSLFRFGNPLGDPGKLLLMMAVGWLGLISLHAQALLFCMITRSPVISSILSVLAGLGVFAGALEAFTGMAGIHVIQYFPAYNVLMAPYITGSTLLENSSVMTIVSMGEQAVSSPLLAVPVSLAWTLLYTVLAAAVLGRKDIC